VYSVFYYGRETAIKIQKRTGQADAEVNMLKTITPHPAILPWVCPGGNVGGGGGGGKASMVRGRGRVRDREGRAGGEWGVGQSSWQERKKGRWWTREGVIERIVREKDWKKEEERDWSESLSLEGSWFHAYCAVELEWRMSGNELFMMILKLINNLFNAE
jgi:hypothetical protein